MAVGRRLSSPFLSGKTGSLPSILFFRSFAAAALSKTATPAGKPAAKKPSGIMKPLPVSPAMQKFIGSSSEVPRTEVIKKIWAYIKSHNLQDPADKKVIVCDAKLKSIFAGNARVGFLQIPGLISPHFLKK